ncbi:MAG TPA: hypothetical protein VJN18_13205 [Polyangiaceae bacterium]|nr:hypothetical protein [Polyangiaceae bacterium]
MTAQRPVIIPKQYRIPRPMSVSLRQQHPIWDIVPFEIAAVLVAALVTLSSLFAAADQGVYSIALRGMGGSEPSASVVVVKLPGEALRRGGCPADLRRALSRARPKALVLLPLAAELCTPEPGPELGRVRRFDPARLRLDRGGRVLGIACPAGDRCLSDLGIVRAADFVSSSNPASMPSLSLDDLASQRLPTGVIGGRVVVLGLSSGEEGNTARLVAAALAGALDAPAYQPASLWVSTFLTALVAAAIGFAQRRRGSRAALVAALLGAVVGSLSFALFLKFHTLFPLASFAVVLLASVGISSLPRTVAARRAVRRASELIERAALIRSQTVHSLPDAEFWARVRSLAAQAHPADEVLIAELPAHHWRLKFWSSGNIGEGAISERRRDVRRTPYVNDQGVPMIRVIRNYLVMKDVPVLVVPLMVLGEIEGYVFLCGVAAERAFAEQPDLATRLSRDLALLLRRRRLGSPDEAKWRRTVGGRVARPSERETALIEGARIALDDLKLFATLVREAPVGLLYADQFGDVRMLGKAVSDWLASFGLKVPATLGDGLLAVNSLPLSAVLGAFAAAAGVQAPLLASLAETSEGVTLRVTVPASASGTPRVDLKLTVRALFSQAESTPIIEGYVAALIENEPHTVEPSRVGRLSVPPRHDALSIFSLTQLVAEVTAAASRRTGRAVRFEPPRTLAYVAGQRQVLARALEEFLVDAATRQGAELGPVVRIQERHNNVTLSVLDLQLGLPSGALQRAVDAPTEAPEGLDALGELVVAVEDSLGRVGLKGEGGWGTTLSAGLVRARPKLPMAASEKADAVVVELSSWTGRAAERV